MRQVIVPDGFVTDDLQWDPEWYYLRHIPSGHRYRFRVESTPEHMEFVCTAGAWHMLYAKSKLC
jgi:hypothetical protein